MDIRQLRGALDERPFRPFTIYLQGEPRGCWITHPEKVWCSQTGRFVVIELLEGSITLTNLNAIGCIRYPEEDQV